jgi:hypothetical protein
MSRCGASLLSAAKYECGTSLCRGEIEIILAQKDDLEEAESPISVFRERLERRKIEIEHDLAGRAGRIVCTEPLVAVCRKAGRCCTRRPLVNLGHPRAETKPDDIVPWDDNGRPELLEDGG